MRLHTNEQINNMTVNDLQVLATTFDYQIEPDSTKTELLSQVTKLERTRTLIVWHDHAMLLGTGYLLMTVHVAYDPAVFFTQQEYGEKNIHQYNRSAVSHWTSSGGNDGSRIICWRSNSTSTRQNRLRGNNVTPYSSQRSSNWRQDTVFVREHLAQQFERGTKRGGRYKCKESMIEDLAHHYTWDGDRYRISRY